MKDALTFGPNFAGLGSCLTSKHKEVRAMCPSLLAQVHDNETSGTCPDTAFPGDSCVGKDEWGQALSPDVFKKFFVA